MLAAANLRPLVSSVGPVLDDIRQDLDLSATAASVLAALPIVCFGVGALLAPRLARRFGSDHVLMIVLGVTSVGLLLRMGPGAVTLFGGTFLAGAALSIANVLIPSMIKWEFPGRTGLMMGLYIAAMMVMGSVAAGLTVPVARFFGNDWRAGMGVWAVPAALAFIVWLAVIACPHHRSVPHKQANVGRSLLRDAVAWKVTAFFSLQSFTFYSLLSWLPSIYRSHGLDPNLAGQLLSVMLVIGVPTALIVPGLLTRLAQQSSFSAATMALMAAGLLGLLTGPGSYPLLWAILIGAGGGAAFPLALTLVVLRSRDAEDAAQLSAMSQSVGYGVAAAGPLVFGLLYDFSGGWSLSILLLVILLVPQVIVGIGAGRATYVRGA